MEQISKQKDKCPGWQGEECWYDKKLKRYVVTGWDSNETCPTCNGTGEKKLDGPDREKIAHLYIQWKENDTTLKLDDLDDFTRTECNMFADKIIALFPDELQFNPDYLDFQKGVEATRAIWKVKLEEAKREEAKRVDISLSALEEQAQGKGLVNRGIRHAVGILRQALKSS